MTDSYDSYLIYCSLNFDPLANRMKLATPDITVNLLVEETYHPLQYVKQSTHNIIRTFQNY